MSVSPPVELAASDRTAPEMERCDASSAYERAAVRFRKGDAVLYLCGHHNGEHGPALSRNGWTLEEGSPSV